MRTKRTKWGGNVLLTLLGSCRGVQSRSEAGPNSDGASEIVRVKRDKREKPPPGRPAGFSGDNRTIRPPAHSYQRWCVRDPPASVGLSNRKTKVKLSKTAQSRGRLGIPSLRSELLSAGCPRGTQACCGQA
jgi:hypothetical protein